MSNLLKNCCVCINNNQNLINILTTDTNQIQWSKKLNKCVPEVNWDYDCLICPNCITQLENAYTFYNLCLQSYKVRKQHITIKTEREEIPEMGWFKAYEIENSMNEGNCVSPKIETQMDIKEFIYIEPEKCTPNPNEDHSCINMNNSDEEFSCTSPDLESAQGTNANFDSLTVKSRHRYGKAYDEFQCWAKNNKANPKCITENLLLAYFSELSEAQKSSSLWSKYSMLRSTIMIHDKVDIKKYNKLLSFLKCQARGYKAKKCNVFNRQHILKFLGDAPDTIYLLSKVVLIIGVAGACGIEEMKYLELDNIQDVGSALLINLKDPITKKQRNFTVMNNQDSNFPDILNIYRKYINLRQPLTSHKRLFVQYLRGKCTTQVVGRHAMGRIPSQIAEYLNLAEPTAYTGHTLRKTSANVLQPITF